MACYWSICGVQYVYMQLSIPILILIFIKSHHYNKTQCQTITCSQRVVNLLLHNRFWFISSIDLVINFYILNTDTLPL